MYAKLADGKLEEFKGDFLKYTIEKDSVKYFISVSNPSEEELNEAGYYRVIPLKDGTDKGNIVYVMSENTIVAVEAGKDEEPSV